MQTLDGGRIGIASQALGLGEGAVNEATGATRPERVQFGRRLSQFQNTQFQLADMHTSYAGCSVPGVRCRYEEAAHEDYPWLPWLGCRR